MLFILGVATGVFESFELISFKQHTDETSLRRNRFGSKNTLRPVVLSYYLNDLGQRGHTRKESLVTLKSLLKRW